jgi:plastocyanin
MKKKYIIISLFFLTLIFLFIVGYSQVSRQSNEQIQTQEPAPTNGKVVATINMNDDNYKPNEVTLNAGEAITFVNKSNSNKWPASNIHPTHELYPEFDPKRELKPGESWTFTFNNKGQWRMHDHLVPYIKGTITVK